MNPQSHSSAPSTQPVIQAGVIFAPSGRVLDSNPPFTIRDQREAPALAVRRRVSLYATPEQFPVPEIQNLRAIMRDFYAQ